jgi:quinol monooxygenase YgiN
MAEPIVFISRHRIKAGRLEDFRQFYREEVEVIKASKPGTLVHLAYVDEAGGEVTFVHLFPDAEAFDIHLQSVGDRTKKAYEFVEPQQFELYGKPSEAALESFKRLVRPGVQLSLYPVHVGGYIRPTAG